MNSLFVRTAVILFISCTIFIPQALAADFKASLAQMPVYAETKDKGVLVDFTKALAEATGKNIEFSVVPFARSMNNVVTGKADFHMPLIAVPDIDMGTLDYDYSTETIFHVNFVMYTKKGSNITKEELPTAKVETDLAHVDYFDFDIKGSTNIEQSLKKVDTGRIDAFIFADFASDPLVKKNNFENIQRGLFKVYEVKIILPKGGRGGPTDQFLSQAIGKLKSSGDFQRIMGQIDTPYDNWQP
jgi:polar amino acid transport system substrate-binding protein